MDVAEPFKINNRILISGETSFSVTDERGRFTFISVNSDGSIHAWGGRPGHEKHRDFRLERIKTIHNTKKERP